MSPRAHPAAARMKVFACERVDRGDTAAPDRRDRAAPDRGAPIKQNRVENQDDLEDSGPPPRSKFIHPAPSAVRRQSVLTPLTRRPSPYSSVTSPSAIGTGLLMPRTPFTFSSISAITVALSFRNSFAFSRP